MRSCLLLGDRALWHIFCSEARRHLLPCLVRSLSVQHMCLESCGGGVSWGTAFNDRFLVVIEKARIWPHRGSAGFGKFSNGFPLGAPKGLFAHGVACEWGRTGTAVTRCAVSCDELRMIWGSSQSHEENRDALCPAQRVHCAFLVFNAEAYSICLFSQLLNTNRSSTPSLLNESSEIV